MIFISCKRTENFDSLKAWQKFTYSDYNGFLYIQHNENRMDAVLCADIAGIQGRFNLSHECTDSQFLKLKQNLIDYGAEYLGETKNPEIKNYPDLSMYLTFVISSDELHEIWKKLGLEND